MSGGAGRLRLCGSDTAQGHCHRLWRFAFRKGVNRHAQAVLAEMHRQLIEQIDGVIACDIAFDGATGEWVEHSIWRADEAPVDAVMTAEVAEAAMRRLHAVP